MGPRVAKTQAHECHKYLDPRLSLSQADSCQIPANGILGLQSNYPVIKTPNLIAIPAKGPNYPPGDSIRITRGLGGYTRQVHSRAPSGESIYLLGDSIRITRGLDLWQIEIHPRRFYPNHPGARGLHPSGALVRTLWQVKSPHG